MLLKVAVVPATVVNVPVLGVVPPIGGGEARALAISSDASVRNVGNAVPDEGPA